LLVLVWMLRAEFLNVRDGIVYGALVGLGFTWFEAALYVAQGYAEYGVAPYGAQLGGRYAIFGFGGHAMFTGMFGGFLALALRTRRTWLRILAPIIGLTLAIAAHMLNNVLPLLAALADSSAGQPPPGHEPPPDIGFLDAFVNGTLLQLTIFLPFLLTTALALWRGALWERRVIREELAGEVGRTVSRGEYQEIVGDRMLRTRRVDRMQRRASAALVNAQHELAFRKRRMRTEGKDPERDRRGRIASRRPAPAGPRVGIRAVSPRLRPASRGAHALRPEPTEAWLRQGADKDQVRLDESKIGSCLTGDFCGSTVGFCRAASTAS
jgi:protease PrsW